MNSDQHALLKKCEVSASFREDRSVSEPYAREKIARLLIEQVANKLDITHLGDEWYARAFIMNSTDAIKLSRP